MKTAQIVVFSDSDGLHEDRLSRAFETRGALCNRVSLVDCRIDLPGGIHIPGVSALPHGAFVRAIPDGSFQQITFRLDILHALEEEGVLVYNSARAIERTVDKGMTSFLLARAGIPSPPTWVCEREEEALRIVENETRQGRQLVLKPLFGNCGRGLVLLDRAAALPALEEVNGVYYLQRFIRGNEAGGRDWRILVIAHQAIAAMERISAHWITNRARGGKCLPAVLTPEIRELAEAACRCTGAAYAGVDIIRDPEGDYLVLEVNSVPAWRGLQSVVEKDITQILADDLLARISRRTPARGRQGTAVMDPGY